MAKIREIIEQVDLQKPNAFPEEGKLRWIAQLDGKIAQNVLLMGVEDLQQFKYRYPEDMETEPLVGFPHEDLYVLWLEAQIDAGNGEWNRYQNTIELYNAAYGNFVEWFANTYRPADGCFEHGWVNNPNIPQYYITAYGLAVKAGYTGSLEEWLGSLKGDKGDKGDPGAKLQIGTVETLPAGSKATASIGGTAQEPVLNLGIPEGRYRQKALAGFIYPWASASIPDGFLLCDGCEYRRTDYEELFDAIGTIYNPKDEDGNVIDDGIHFNVPNLSERVPVGSSFREDKKYELGAMDGEETHTLTEPEMPSHSQGVKLFHSNGNSSGMTAAWTNKLDTTNGTTEGYYLKTGNGLNTSSAGGSQPHNNMQPYTVVNYIIATGKGKTIGYAVAPEADGGDAAVIDDSVVSLDKTWSSRKIADEIANIPSGGGVGDMDISGDDVVVFTTDDFELPFSHYYGDKIVNDADACSSKVACYTTSDNTLKMRHLCGDVEHVVGDLSFAQMTSAYKVYRFSYCVPVAASATDKFLLHSDGDFRIDDFEGFAACAGEIVDIYLSMKAVANNDSTYSYYVDRVVVARPFIPECYVDSANGDVCEYTEVNFVTYNSISDIPTDHNKFDRGAASINNGGGVEVTDASAYSSKARKTTISGETLQIKQTYVRNDGSNTTALIGELALADMVAKTGYNLYEFTYTPKENGRNVNIGGMTSNQFGWWDMNTYAGEVVKLYFSIKVEVTATAGTYDVYVDRMALATMCSFTDYVDNGNGTETAECDVDGCKVKATKKVFDNIDAIPAEHLTSVRYAYGVADTDAVAYVDDADVYGKAVMMTAASRAGEAHNGLNVGAYGLPIKLVNTNDVDENIIYLGKNELTADGKYHLYKINNVTPIKQNANAYKTAYLFDDKGLQIPGFAAKLSDYKDKEVDIYISMKITGDLSFADAYNLPVFYIDRIIVTDGAKEIFPGTGAVGHPVVESASQPGCYKIKYNDGDQWVNPPMIIGEEHKTTERINDVPVYSKFIYHGKGSSGSFQIDPKISGPFMYMSIMVKAIDPLGINSFFVSEDKMSFKENLGLAIGGTPITVNAGRDTSNMEIVAMIKYIKFTYQDLLDALQKYS